MNVILVEPCLEISKVHLSKWLIKGSFAYSQVRDVQIWLFRVQYESQIGFAMVKVELKEPSRLMWLCFSALLSSRVKWCRNIGALLILNGSVDSSFQRFKFGKD
ncbi:hypothetical protein SCA6_002775 [Theobroma cacao]